MATKKNTEFKELIEAAVNYWANFFSSPAYGDKANGEQLSDFGSTLMTLVKATANKNAVITKLQISTFRKLVTEYLQQNAAKERDCSLDTDWAPEYPLSDFLRKAELPNTFFPSKTWMSIKFSKNVVTVQGEQIYPALKKEKVA